MNTETREKLRRYVLDVAAMLEITRDPADLVQCAMTLRNVAERILDAVAMSALIDTAETIEEAEK
jgi:hypothetical protein